MYTTCQACRHSLGRNVSLAHMPVGRTVAYDAARGRLWIVCRRCHEWSLTPLEERWEAVEECERLYRSADVRVASREADSTVGLADVADVRLLRLGDAPRDEIANARYGPRLLRRRTRHQGTMILGGIVAGVGVGTLILLGSWSHSAPIMITLGLFGLYYAFTVASAADRFRLVRIYRPDGSAAWLTGPDVQAAFVPGRRNQERLTADLTLWTGRSDERFYGDAVLPPLACVLAALNSDGAAPELIRAAVTMVDEAERAVAHGAPRATALRDGHGQMAWQRLLQGRKGAESVLWRRPLAEKLALEMAVTEERERRLLERDAASAVPAAVRESEVAGIADDMFLPQTVLDWLARYKSQQSDRRARSVV